MLTIGLSPTGDGVPTHYVCARVASKREMDDIEEYQQKLMAADKARGSVTLCAVLSAKKARVAA